MSRLRASETQFTRPADVVDKAVVSVFRVPPEVAGQRLDVFVHSQLHRTSRTRAQAIVRASAYDPTGRKLVPNDRVRAEQHILLWRAPWDETPTPGEITILYEDEHLLAVDKPALLPVHPTARYFRNTLIKKLQDARPDAAFLSLAHRLDRETSGVMIVTKSRECDRTIKRQLEHRDGVEKVYAAVTWGVPDRGDGAREFRHEQRMVLDTKNELRVKMRAARPTEGLYASTLVRVQETRRNAAGRTYALVSLTLETGRQHQIRLHLSLLGTPVVGDKLYGPDEQAFARGADGTLTEDDLTMLELPRHALHAARLTLRHPMTGEELALEAPLPEDIAGFWRRLAKEDSA